MEASNPCVFARLLLEPMCSRYVMDYDQHRSLACRLIDAAIAPIRLMLQGRHVTDPQSEDTLPPRAYRRGEVSAETQQWAESQEYDSRER